MIVDEFDREAQQGEKKMSESSAEALAFIEAGLAPGIYAPVMIYPTVKVEEVVTTVRRLQAV